MPQFRLKLKKVEKTTRPFRYDLNQIPYDYTVKMRNRCEGLDLIDRMPVYFEKIRVFKAGPSRLDTAARNNGIGPRFYFVGFRN